MRISIIINADTRAGFTDQTTQAEQMFNGCRSLDFITEGVVNKSNFFYGFEREIILFIDEHHPVPEFVLSSIRSKVDTLVIRKHSKYFNTTECNQNFNDFNYLAALFQARGDIVCHFDADTCAFTRSAYEVSKLINLLSSYKFVSYPSPWSPRAITDHSFGVRTWASTRFFLAKRDALKFDILEKCLLDPEWAYATFGDSPRRCNWLEHFLSLTNENSVFYPPVTNDLKVFSWDKYITGTLSKLNEMTYDQILDYIKLAGGIHYPVDLTCIPI